MLLRTRQLVSSLNPPSTTTVPPIQRSHLQSILRRCLLTHLCCICCGGSISTNVGLFFAASFPPSLSSGNPGLVRSLDNRSSVKTIHMSLCLTTSHAWLPSQSSTLEIGSCARRYSYSVGGSAPLAQAKGNLRRAGEDCQRAW